MNPLSPLLRASPRKGYVRQISKKGPFSHYAIRSQSAATGLKLPTGLGAIAAGRGATAMRTAHVPIVVCDQERALRFHTERSVPALRASADKEGSQCVDRLGRRLLGEEMPTLQRVPANVLGPFPPEREWTGLSLVPGVERPVRTP